MVTFRRAGDADHDLLAALASSRWSHLPLPELADLQDHAQRASYVAQWGPEGEHVVLADDVAVGRAWWADSETERVIVDIAILPAARGRGIGTAVIEALLDTAGGRVVRATVDVAQPAWLARFVDLGFADVGGDWLFRRLTWSPSETPCPRR
jgi:GNAT superfamily N-acetyltransferase